ncbi:MAG: hypothetical protein IJZ39_11650 [Oscillospiraceae bacterium]|nr:hypothetical protein [Oscillospiraceae bacterium]
MIQGGKWMIIEPEDIVGACDRLERIMVAANKQVEVGAPAIQGIESAAGVVVGDIFIAIAAAGIGAAICKQQQGGLLVMKEGASQEDYQEAKAAMDELRKKQRKAAADAKAAPETIPQ